LNIVYILSEGESGDQFFLWTCYYGSCFFTRCV